MTRAADLELVAVTKQYGETVAVNAIDLRIAAGTYCCLLGPSGCGKTSTLRMVAGHEAATVGDILLGNQNVTDKPPAARGFFGTAIEVLEEKIEKQPQDFDLWMKLAETHCRYCGNPNRAEKIIQRMEKDFAFGPEQIQSAKTRLTEWRAARN